MKNFFSVVVALLACFSVKAQTVLNGDYTITGQLQIGNDLNVRKYPTTSSEQSLTGIF